jgi:hypothetical protein
MYGKSEEPNQIIRFETEEELKDWLRDARVQKNGWDGPGYYAQYTYSQRCPRGCCYDDVREAVPLQEFIDELEESVNNKRESLEYWKEVLNKKEIDQS